MLAARRLLFALFVLPVLVLLQFTASVLAQGGAPGSNSSQSAPGYMGARHTTLTREKAADLGRPELQGVLVVWPQPGMPAAAAGLEPWDVVLTIDGRQVTTSEQLVGTIMGKGAGHQVALGVLRAGMERTIMVALAGRPAEPTMPGDFNSLQARMEELYAAGKDGEAMPLAEELLRRAEVTRGASHWTLGSIALKLGSIYRFLGRLEDSERSLKRALDVLEPATGPSDPLVSDALTELGNLHSAQRRFAEAEAVYRRALYAREKLLGRNHASIAVVAHNLGVVHNRRRQYALALPLLKRALEIDEKTFGPHDPQLSNGLNTLANAYYGLHHYDEAEALYKRSIAIMEKRFGSGHANVSNALNNLANMYRDQARYAEAEALLKRVLAINESAFGPEHKKVAAVLNGLGVLSSDLGRHAEAERFYRRSLAIEEKQDLGDPLDVARVLNNLGTLQIHVGRYVEAESTLRRMLTIYERESGADHPSIATGLLNLGVVLRHQGRYVEGEKELRRALRIGELAAGASRDTRSFILTELANALRLQGRYSEAESLYRRGIEIAEQVFGPEHPKVANVLNDLALLYWTQRRYRDAEALLKRSLSVRETALGQNHLDVSMSLTNLAGIYKDLTLFDEALGFYERALAINEKVLDRDHPGYAMALMNVANIHSDRGRFGEAEPLYLRALAIRERALGPEHPEVGECVTNLAVMYRRMGRLDDAIRHGLRNLALQERSLGPEHPQVARSLWFLAHVHWLKRDLEPSYLHYKRATDYWLKRGDRREIGDAIDTFAGHLRAAINLAAEDPSRSDALHKEAFRISQWTGASEAADAVARMSVRAAAHDPAITALVRERQDLVGRRAGVDQGLIASVSLPAAQRNRDREAALRNEVAELDAQARRIDAQLADEFPQFAALANAEALTTTDVQKLLRPDEALLKISLVVEEGYAWLVTPTEVRLTRLPFKYTEFRDFAAAMRCGLDSSSWSYPQVNDSDLGEVRAAKLGQRARADRCLKLVRAAPSDEHLSPFDLALAHKLYNSLFGGVEDLIKDKHLLIVPPDPLAQIPFQALVTKMPDGSPSQQVLWAPSMKGVEWLGMRQPITVLPAVSSLKALRRVARPTLASKPMIGFGNPLLDGRASAPDEADAARLARAMQRCVEPMPTQIASLGSRGAGMMPLATRGGTVDVAELRAARPLPETASELCTVAREVRADAADIHLGERATERGIKALSASGKLANYRFIHFATHAALAGELRTSAEPGLILTPPATPSEEDDGYLSASEIGALKLDADWVILSACNTAGPAGGKDSGADALSGLARMFFYAGARALLVSHWAVNSEATVKLITSATRKMAADPTVGRAEAMRRAMKALVEHGAPHEAHPAYWAPFVVVGEGAAAR